MVGIPHHQAFILHTQIYITTISTNNTNNKNALEDPMNYNGSLEVMMTTKGVNMDCEKE